jgi:outer membrane protein insertion porin family
VRGAALVFPLSGPSPVPYSARPRSAALRLPRLTVSARTTTTAALCLSAALLGATSARGQTAAPATSSAPSPPPNPDAGAPSQTAKPDTATPPEQPKAEGASAASQLTKPDTPAAAGSDTIVEIRVEGNRRVEPAAVTRALKNKVGSAYDPNLTAADLQGLWALGYFADIQLLTQVLPQGGLAYIIRVIERPTVHIVKLEGNEELGTDDFKDDMDIKGYSILDMDAVRRNAKKIQQKYFEKGFFLAEVTYRIDPWVPGTTPGKAVPNSKPTANLASAAQAEEWVDINFVINEHAKVMVKSINLIGAIRVSPDELKAQMATQEGSYLSFITQAGTYREEMFQRDLAVIEAAYYDRGYLNVKVEKPSVSLSPDKKLIFIDIRIEEGDPFRISKVDFAGDLLFPKEQLYLQVISRPGEYFSRQAIIHDDNALAEMYQDLGFAYANWTPETAIDPVAKTVAVTFTVQKGKPQLIETITIVGNTKTRDRVIRREMRIYEGELFRGSGVRVSKERITALGFFETVEINFKPGSDDSHVAITTEVKEKATGAFQVGAGFSSVENFIFTAQVSQSNFLGWGNTASLSAQVSGLRQLFTASFYEPYFLDSPFIFTLDLFRTQIDSYDFTRQSIGGAVGWGYHLLDDLTGAVTYTLEGVSAIPGGSGINGGLIPTSGAIPSPANRFRSGVTSAVRFALTYDRRDNRLYPTKGLVLYGSVEVAPDWLGGNFNFARFQAYTRFYVPLPGGLIFKTQFTIGYIAELNPANPLPISEQYLLGGINSLRGYALNSISPTELIGTVARGDFIASQFTTGGNKEFIVNVELEIPIIPKAGVRGVLFFDAGNVFAVNANFFQDFQYRLPLGLFMAAGWGVRWFSPVGPLRFEWGVPLTPRPQDQGVLFEFTIGNSF